MKFLIILVIVGVVACMETQAPNKKREEGRDGKSYYLTYGNDMYVPVRPTVEDRKVAKYSSVLPVKSSSYYYGYRPYYYDRIVRPSSFYHDERPEYYYYV